MKNKNKIVESLETVFNRNQELSYEKQKKELDKQLIETEQKMNETYEALIKTNLKPVLFVV